MSIYSDLREKLYDSLALVFPSNQIIQAYSNGPEPVTPYVIFDIGSVKQEGQEYVSSFTDMTGNQQVASHYTCRVRIEFAGKSDDFRAADLANDFFYKIDTTPVQEVFLKNALSYMRKSSVRKVPKKRETDWYMFYQIDLYFGYQVESYQNVDVIDSVEILGDYQTFQQTINIP
jgi:hypothetical protein